MATQEQPPKSDNSTTQEQVPHSGVMGYEQPPARQFDNTTLSEAVAQGLIETPTSPEPLMSPTEAPAELESPKRSWNQQRMIAAGALGLTLAAAAFGIGKATNGNETNSEPRTEPSVSAPAVPVETLPPVSNFNPDSLITADNFPQYMIQPNADPASIMSGFDNVVSYVINQRVDNGIEGPNTSELQLLNDSNGENIVLEDFVDLIQRDFEGGKEFWKEEGRGDIRFAFMSTVKSVEQTPAGGYVITTDDEYWALDSHDQFVGYAIGNRDERQYTFDKGSITLPTGEVMETYVVSDIVWTN